uniref:t-SNARE coiled-coil homology domain-containing protein n=1 Tax=Odontella aurita TaxID=265563 RepID=A0A6U6D6E7_9STRA|mmetsp:Transcript_18750/g.54141  ORF Transcript_18750/g.54141 Transcript_18750/m.54141 type:complete len:284 (+) Transcript_18750:548-1399(+)
MFSQRSAFDEALSRPLVPSNNNNNDEEEHDGAAANAKKTNKKKQTKKKNGGGGGGIGMGGRGSVSPNRSTAGTSSARGAGGAGASGRLPSFGGPSSGNSASAAAAGADGYAPPSAVSSVVSEDDAAHAGNATASGNAAFDPAVSSSAFETEAGEDYGGNGQQQQRQQQQQGQQSRELRRHESLDSALLRERNAALVEVTRSMGLVHTIQRELSSLVGGQQEDIDDIEANAAEVRESTERGVHQLERAREGMRDGCGSRWREAALASVGGTATVAAVVFWLLAK